MSYQKLKTGKPSFKVIFATFLRMRPGSKTFVIFKSFRNLSTQLKTVKFGKETMDHNYGT